MIGCAGTIFGRHGINIVSAAVGRQPEEQIGEGDRVATMAITTDVAVPRKVVDEIVRCDGFEGGATVSL
jgi:D-3-phosphoglycerate dehydrogenase